MTKIVFILALLLIAATLHDFFLKREGFSVKGEPLPVRAATKWERMFNEWRERNDF